MPARHSLQIYTMVVFKQFDIVWQIVWHLCLLLSSRNIVQLRAAEDKCQALQRPLRIKHFRFQDLLDHVLSPRLLPLARLLAHPLHMLDHPLPGGHRYLHVRKCMGGS